MLKRVPEAIPRVRTVGDVTVPRVSIVILNWNGWADTLECLASLEAATYPALDVIVVDNASRDDSIERMTSWLEGRGLPWSMAELGGRDAPLVAKHEAQHRENRLPEVLLIASTTNLGFCGGNNVGMETAFGRGSDHVVVLNNDTVCSPEFLEPLVAAAEPPDVGLVGGVICYADEPQTIWWAGGRFLPFLETRRDFDRRPLAELDRRSPFETDWISGCMMLVPRRVFESVGGYDEDFFIWSEEWDLSLRARRHDYRLMVAPASRIYHKVARSLGDLAPLSYYYGTRNRLLLKRKHLSAPLRWLFLSVFLPSRIVRFTGFVLTGRGPIAAAGFHALADYTRGRVAKWERQPD